MESERQREILSILTERGRVSVSELAARLYVSEMTVRRDLSEMESGGFLKRYRGGAILKNSMGEMPITERFFVDEGEKKQLCSMAAKHICDGDTVFLDSSSTCLYVIPHLQRFSNITLLTNSVKALMNASALHIPTMLIGGEYYEQDMCLVGPIAEELAKDLNVDVAFMSTAAYSSDGVISDFDLRQTAVRKIIMKNSKKNVFLFERSKLGKKLPYTLARKEETEEVITV